MILLVMGLAMAGRGDGEGDFAAEVRGNYRLFQNMNEHLFPVPEGWEAIDQAPACAGLIALQQRDEERRMVWYDVHGTAKHQLDVPVGVMMGFGEQRMFVVHPSEAQVGELDCLGGVDWQTYSLDRFPQCLDLSEDKRCRIRRREAIDTPQPMFAVFQDGEILWSGRWWRRRNERRGFILGHEVHSLRKGKFGWSERRETWMAQPSSRARVIDIDKQWLEVELRGRVGWSDGIFGLNLIEEGKGYVVRQDHVHQLVFRDDAWCVESSWRLPWIVTSAHAPLNAVHFDGQRPRFMDEGGVGLITPKPDSVRAVKDFEVCK